MHAAVVLLPTITNVVLLGLHTSAAAHRPPHCPWQQSVHLCPDTVFAGAVVLSGAPGARETPQHMHGIW